MTRQGQRDTASPQQVHFSRLSLPGVTGCLLLCLLLIILVCLSVQAQEGDHRYPYFVPVSCETRPMARHRKGGHAPNLASVLHVTRSRQFPFPGWNRGVVGDTTGH